MTGGRLFGTRNRLRTFFWVLGIIVLVCSIFTHGHTSDVFSIKALILLVASVLIGALDLPRDDAERDRLADRP